MILNNKLNFLCILYIIIIQVSFLLVFRKHIGLNKTVNPRLSGMITGWIIPENLKSHLKPRLPKHTSPLHRL